MTNIMSKKFLFLIISLVMLVASLVFLAVFRLQPSIDFSSGSLTILSFEKPVERSALVSKLDEIGYDKAIVQETSEGYFSIRTQALNDPELHQLESSLTDTFGPLKEQAFYYVDPVVAHQTVRIAAIGIALAAVGMLIYITWAFRKMPKPFYYGTCAVVALLHDVIIVMGVFSIMGVLMGWEVDLLFITGILAVIGYAVNNTVVIFDRVRENLSRGMSTDIEVVVNASVLQSLSRSINTSWTTLITILALILIVGATIQTFLAVLFIGIFVGTFSSLFVAPTLLVVWEKGQWGGFIGRRQIEG